MAVDKFANLWRMAEEKKQQWASLALVGVLGSGSGMGGTVLYLNNIEPSRPNAAIVTELRELRRELEYHLHNHPDQLNQFDRRLTRLEARLEILLEQE